MLEASELFVTKGSEYGAVWLIICGLILAECEQ